MDGQASCYCSNNRSVKGVILGTHESTEVSAVSDLSIVLGPTPKPPSRQGTFESPLKSYITKNDPTWKDFVSAFTETNSGLKAGLLLQSLSRRRLFPSIRSAYMGIVWRE